jgi:hypothetical protein
MTDYVYFMENNPEIPEEFISGISEISIDASSMIYLLKIGLLGSVSAEITLLATQGVIDEVQWPRLPVTSCQIHSNELTNDESVVRLAEIRKISVLSEDQEVLLNARSRGLNHYNTLMILNYLFLKMRISGDEYDLYLERLKEISFYSKSVLEYGELLHQIIMKSFLQK